MKYFGCFREGSKINQILCAVLINLPVFTYGASIGWVSPMTMLLQSDHSPKKIPLSDIEVTMMAATPYVISIPFNIMMAMISDKFGRKTALIIISLGNAGNWILLLYSTEIWVLLLARVMVGVPMAGCYVTCPIYTKEISHANIRGALGCLTILFHTMGNLFLYIIGDILNYNTINWICLILPIIHIAVFFAMPESPSYLVKKGEIKEATKAIAWLRCRSEVDSEVVNEIENLKKELKQDDGANSSKIKSVLTDKTMNKAFKISTIATLAREITGTVILLNFAEEIFTIATKGSGLIISPNQQTIILGSVQVLGAVVAFSLVETTGRKLLLSLTTLVSGLSMCALASWFVLKAYHVSAPSWLPLATLCLCIFCDSAGLQPISVVLVAEMFSFKYRGMVLGTTMAISSFAEFLELLFFTPVIKKLRIQTAFFFFGICCILLVVYLIIAIPETKARCLDDIYKDLDRGSKKEDLRESEDDEHVKNVDTQRL